MGSVGLMLALGLVGCGGGDDGSEASEATTATTALTTQTDPPPSTTATTSQPIPTVTPADYPSALTNRLATEWDDETLANEVVVGLAPESLATLEERVPADDLATDPLLTYRPDPLPADEIDSLIVFTFGYRGEDTDRDPGPVNEAMADTVEAFVADHPVPVFAQTTVANLLTEREVPNVTSLDQGTDSDGNLVYLSTEGAAQLAVSKSEEAGEPLGTVGVVGFADHVGRCLLTTESVGLTAGVPEGLDLPDDYDPESSQPWTRSRAAYLPTDLQARIALPT